MVMNQAKENHRRGDSIYDTSNVPPEVMSELEELGVDSWVIIQAIIKQFSHLFSS